MSGHSKWANIKHKKEAKDAQRSNVFSKMSRLLATAVQEGGGIADPEKNFKLRLAVDRAKAANMPKDTIQRAIDKASGAGAEQMKEMVYEGFGPGGSALMISAITDNGNRTFSEIRQIVDKAGGKIAGKGAVSHLFTKCGVIELDKSKVTEQQAFELFDKLEGIDLEDGDETYIVFVPFDAIGRVKEVLGTVAAGVDPKALDVYYLPSSPIDVDSSTLDKIERLADNLEDHDDVQNVYTNVEG